MRSLFFTATLVTSALFSFESFASATDYLASPAADQLVRDCVKILDDLVRALLFKWL